MSTHLAGPRRSTQGKNEKRTVRDWKRLRDFMCRSTQGKNERFCELQVAWKGCVKARKERYHWLSESYFRYVLCQYFMSENCFPFDNLAVVLHQENMN